LPKFLYTVSNLRKLWLLVASEDVWMASIKEIICLG